jgi:hypothetical protein
MSCDKLVFDLSQEVEGSPSVFVKKDWVSILDNQNGSYNSNQSVIDTSQLSNSNKYMSYREAYLMMPMLLTIAQTNTGADDAFEGETGCANAFGLKNWFGTMIHSFTLDYNGTTIVQQTPFINMWNSFKLMTTLSWSDVATIGSTIGFYPDDPLTWGYSTAVSSSGMRVANNSTAGATAVGLLSISTSNGKNKYASGGGNVGLLKRIQYINYNGAGIPLASAGAGTYESLLRADAPNVLWKSFVKTKIDSLTAGTVKGVYQIVINATIYLKHIHSFFQQCPLLKGVFMKMTMNLNNTSGGYSKSAAAAGTLTLDSITIPVGGVCPLMISSTAEFSGGNTTSGSVAGVVGFDLSVGNKCLSGISTTTGVTTGSNNSINLYVPAYTFNPTFERAYLSSPVKSIKYTDVYQYQTVATSNTPFNSLITNGIAGIKSVLILPFHKAATVGTPTISPWQSPFDPAGAGPTSPLCLLTNFNVVVSGQNMLYNTQRYAFEQFNNQLYGVNAVNGGLTDGLTSGLINSLGFEMEYCYYYVDVSRMLPVEETVPKSVQIIGTSQSAIDLDLIVFIEYGCSVDIDILTGARV